MKLAFRPARPFVFCLFLLTTLAIGPRAHAERQWFDSGAVPSRYGIAVTPNVDAGTFAGDVSINVHNDAELATVIMNALDLTVGSAQIDGRAATFTTDATAQTLTLTPRRPLAAGDHVIHIVYSGKIYDEPYGLFRISYTDADGKPAKLLSTQFEPGDARRLAPMWDQPNRRAVFSITVTAPAAQMAVSNMPVASVTQLRGGLARTTFQDSPSMASYLIFLGVGDFERATANVDGVEVGVVVRRGALPRAQQALRDGVDVVRYYNEYFGIQYPLPKLDMIAIPGAGGFGAMENWGAILYFDQYLLIDEDRSSAADRQRVFSIVAHETAHQWFGDLVTMNWWDNLWLNEGFASWMAAKAVDHLHADWKPWLDQMSDGTSSAMTLDSRAGTHPIVQNVDTIDEANLAFDAITYEKGLAVIRMLEAYVGEDAFRKGVHDYLNAHKYGNAVTEDLWSTVQAASGQPVLEIARSFTTQPGFPVLRAQNAACTRRNQDAHITLQQQRYAADDVSRTAELWTIPVVARRLNGEPLRTVLPAQAQASIELSPPCGPYLVNAGQSGFFRVLYDQANLTALTQQFASLDSADQLGLLLDYWSFGRTGDAPFTDLLEMIKRAPADAAPVVVSEIADDLVAFADYAKGRPSEASIKAYGRRILRPYFDRLGWVARPDEASNVNKLRATLIGALGHLEDPDIVAEARRRVSAAANDPSTLAGGIRDATMATYAYNISADDFDALVAQAKAAQDFVEQRRLWLRVAVTKDPALAARALAMTEGEDIPRHLRTQVISVVASNHPRLAWEFVVAHRALIEGLLDPLQRLDYPSGIASANTETAVVAELRDYAKDFPEGAQRSVTQATASITLRAQTIAERMPAVEAWIAQQH